MKETDIHICAGCGDKPTIRRRLATEIEISGNRMQMGYSVWLCDGCDKANNPSSIESYYLATLKGDLSPTDAASLHLRPKQK